LHLSAEPGLEPLGYAGRGRRYGIPTGKHPEMIEAMYPYRPHSHHEDARLLTKDLRTSDEPSWNAVRKHLIDAGFHPQESAVGDLFPEQPGDFGVLVTADRRMFTFEVGQESVRGQPGT
jgi:hypothetical protein